MNTAKWNTDDVARHWRRAGVNHVGVHGSRTAVRIEELIARTTVLGRRDPRLIHGMVAWIARFGDLLNISLLRKAVSSSDGAVLGAVLESAVGAGGDPRLSRVLRACRPKAEPELMFPHAGRFPSVRLQALTAGDAICAKWNVCCVEMPVKSDILFGREYVLKHNPELRRRALLGCNMKSAILELLLQRGAATITEIMKATGFRYPAIHHEVSILTRDFFLDATKQGRKRVLRLRPSIRDYLSSVPT